MVLVNQTTNEQRQRSINVKRDHDCVHIFHANVFHDSMGKFTFLTKQMEITSIIMTIITIVSTIIVIVDTKNY